MLIDQAISKSEATGCPSKFDWARFLDHFAVSMPFMMLNDET
jgi:hypothetical protein